MDVTLELSGSAGLPVSPGWTCVFLPWCCAASSDRESVCAGAVVVFALPLQFECSWIRSDNDGLPLGSTILVWLPTPDDDWLVDRSELRLNPEGDKDGLVVVIELVSERLLSGTERSDGDELGGPEDIFKDAKVPRERLFWLHIMDDGDIDPLVRALNEGSPKLWPVSLSSLVFCTFMSCERLIPLKPGPRLFQLPELLPNLCCRKCSRKFSASCFVHCCVSTEPSVWIVCVLDVMSL